MFQTKDVEKTKTLVLCSTAFLDNFVIREIMCKNTAEFATSQKTIWRKRFACWITKATKNTRRICNTFCFSTATIAARKRFNVTLLTNRLNTLWHSYRAWNSDTVFTQTINRKQTSGYKTRTVRNFKRQQLKWILITWNLSWKANSPFCSQEILHFKEQKFPCPEHNCPALVPVLGYLHPIHAICHRRLNTV